MDGSKKHEKGKTTKNGQLNTSSNRCTPLTNLDVHQADSFNLSRGNEWTTGVTTTHNHKYDKRLQRRKIPSMHQPGPPMNHQLDEPNLQKPKKIEDETYSIPTIVNMNPNHQFKLKYSNSVTNRINNIREYSKCYKQTSKKQHKVIILGDSHARGYAAGVKHLLGNDFEVFGSINPGSGMERVKDTAKVKVQQLTKKDAVVLWGGSNDVARNNSLVGLKHILEFVMNANRTNVILVSAPHRHDLISASCVNNEVEVFNRKLHKKLERFRKIEMIEVVNERIFYTRHGQHLNSAGKDSMAKKTATMIERLLEGNGTIMKKVRNTKPGRVI